MHEGLPARPVVQLRPELADRLSGMSFPEDEQRETLGRIGFDVGDGGTVTVPTWRALDVTRSVDLVEEVVRFRMEEVPATLPERQAMFGQLTREQRLRRLVEDVLVGAGYREGLHVELRACGRRQDRASGAAVERAGRSAPRGPTRHGLLESARRNANAGVERIALFELAHVYLPSGDELPHEPWHVAGITVGGFFRAKGAVEALYGALHLPVELERGEGRSARLAEGSSRSSTTAGATGSSTSMRCSRALSTCRSTRT